MSSQLDLLRRGHFSPQVLGFPRHSLTDSSEHAGKGICLLGVVQLPKRAVTACAPEVGPCDPSTRQADIQTVAREPGSPPPAQEARTMVLRHRYVCGLVRGQSLLTERSPHLLENFFYRE